MIEIHPEILMMAVFLIAFGGCVSSFKGQRRETAFYVSTEGNDSWSGRLPATNLRGTDGPFATLERARDAIRALKRSGGLPEGGVTVYIRGGIYTLTEMFQLTSEDSGAQDAPIVYRAYRDEEVRLIGGREISGFRPIDDPAVLSRIDGACRDKMLQVDLRAQGITDFGELMPRGFGRPIYPAGLELFFQGRPMTLARWPNRGWVKIVDVPAGKGGGKFTYEGDRPKRWLKADDIWVHGYWTWDWADSYEKVESIDTLSHEIATCEPHGVYGYSPGNRYYALNILEELDEPGEWYLDRKTGILYFWPPAPIGEGRAFVSILSDPMVSMRDVSHVILRDLTFEYTRGNAIEITGGEHNLVAGCTIRNIGNTAIVISDGREIGAVGCDICRTGDGGIRLSGGDRLTLTPGGNYAINNHIYDYSRWVRTYRPAVMVGGVGNRVAHNLIHDGPHTAILLHGNEHVIEFNEIHDVCLETSDVGAFYMGRDWTERGNIVRYNYFHHLGNIGGIGSMAIYLDDWASGTTVFGNICYRAGRAVLIGGGRDNTIENNIFIDCEPAVHVDARGLGWAKYYFDGTNTTLVDRLNAVNYREPPYSERYPELLTLYDDDPAVPKGNLIVRNIAYSGRWLELLDGLDDRIVSIRDNLVGEDPGFVDPERGNFQLRDDSPAYKLGFRRIPVEKIGLYRDEYRRSLPAGR